jgi:uncharacterized YceG family protein
MSDEGGRRDVDDDEALTAPRRVAAGRAAAARRAPGGRAPGGTRGRAPRRRRRRGRAGRRLLALLAFLVVLAALWAVNETFQPFKGDAKGPGVAVRIPSGADAGAIGKLLAAKGIVGHARFFELNATLTFRRGDLRTGEYVLPKGMSNGQAIEALMQGPQVRVTKTYDVTLPEGRSRRETARALAADHAVKGSYMKATATKAVLRRAHALGLPRSRTTAEGFFFPATYELEVGASARDLVTRQLDAFEQNFGTLDLRYAKSKHLTRYDVLIIASLVEREAAVAKDRPLIAAVIYNRLHDGMALGIDATLRYESGDWTSPLKESQLRADTPYNTRINTGLPPTPIGSPGLASLKAAANPAKVGYRYFVVKPGTCGEHAFATTQAQHDRNVATYNEARARNGGKSPVTC